VSDERTDPAALEAAREAGRGTMMERMGLEWEVISPGRVVASIPVEGNTQPYGLLHGGATAALVETLGSFGAALAAGAGKRVLGVQLSVNHLRSVEEGRVRATGTALHDGRTTAVWDVRVEDDRGRLVAVGRLTLAVREAG
jgi:uncharacterized protein (TIGR00369 family)